MTERARLRGLPLGGLLAFEAAARLGSFKAAALERSVTPAAISQQVKSLELAIGTVLFARLNRALELTPVGARLAETCSACFANLQGELRRLRDEGAIWSASIAVSAAPTLATKWLAPRLHKFLEQNPAIDVRLNAENELRSPGRDPQVDVSLRYGAGPYRNDLVAEPMWEHGLVVPVCSPDLLPQHPVHPAELASNILLGVELPPAPADVAKADWSAWLKVAGLAGRNGEQSPRAASTFGNHNLAIEAAANGQGIVLAPLVLITDELRSGRLVLASSVYLADPNRFWILHRAARETVGIRSFINWLRAEALLTAEVMESCIPR